MTLIQFLLKFCKSVETVDDESCETIVKKKLLGRWYEVKHYVNTPVHANCKCVMEPDTRWHKTVD